MIMETKTKLPVGGWGGGVVMQTCSGGEYNDKIRVAFLSPSVER